MVGEAYSIKLGREFCEEHLAAAYSRERDRLKALGRIAPDLAEQARVAIDAKEAENRVLLDGMLADEEARKEAFGLGEAERDWDRAEQAEHEAAIAVCAYPCRTLEEARLKAEYLAKSPGLSDGLQDEQREALLQSFSEPVC